MFKKILVAYDGSDYAVQAYELALEMALLHKAELFVLSVVKLPEPMVEITPAAYVDQATNFYNRNYETLAAQLPANTLGVHQEVQVGRPSEMIVKFSIDKNIDLIVIGVTKGKSFLEKIMIGSVSRTVVEQAPCSVLVVR